MESLYVPESFRASEHLELDSYFKQYSKVCPFPEHSLEPTGTHYDNEAYLNRIREEMDIIINIEEMKQLETICSISALTLSEEPQDVPVEVPENLHTKSKLQKYYPINDIAKKLNVMICLQDLQEKHELTSNFKIGSKRFIKTATLTMNKSVFCDMRPGSNFIYSIIIYRPFIINFNQRNSGDKLRFVCEIEALGTNTLAEIADQIYCAANEGLLVEVENTSVDLKPLRDSKRYYPSQCIYIDGVLYNDFRSPKSIDYSFNIIKWANEQNIGKFTTQLMDQTKLNTLKPRLGYPYVYMHQGNCEHLFTFSDARLLQPGDCLNSKKYPRFKSINRDSNILCFICRAVNARWIVLNCAKFPHDKVFLCTTCCNSYLYVNGEKIAEFSLYPYYNQGMMAKHLDADVE